MSDIIPNPSSTCQVDWCGEPGEHAGNHRRILGEVTCPEYNKASAIVEAGPAEVVDALPVLTLVTAFCVPIAATRLDWVGSARLGGLLSEAVTRFA